MSSLLYSVVLFLMSGPLYAAMKEMDAANAPAETVNVVWVVVFVVLFIVTCVGFFAYIWLKDDKSEQTGSDK